MRYKLGLARRGTWTVAAWLAIAALIVAGIALDDVSIAIGAGVAAVWAVCFGFFPALDRS